MKDNFLKITGHTDLANFFDLTYLELTKIIYEQRDSSKYYQFQIAKKNGGHRKIASPTKKLKAIQLKLKDILYEIYPIKPQVHGFAKGKSIVTNAKMHLDKKYIFNIDLADFYGSIHFGRVRNLFKSYPFNFNNTVATILAQICCFNNSLPQGAPTSPILSNMIALKLDLQLQRLAKETNSTYTRYVDDISFSFTSNKDRLPKELIIIQNGRANPGDILTYVIKKNGFNINYDKVRLCSTLSRMEVTGLTVNKFPNVKRQYVRQISSMLHAWRKYGYELAEKEFNDKYNQKHGRQQSYLYVVKGKLAFLKSVRQDVIFNKLAQQFNALVDNEHKFKIVKIVDHTYINALWVIENDDDKIIEDRIIKSDKDNSETKQYQAQGSAFQLKDVGIVTCAHVVSDTKSKKLLKGLKVYKYSNSATKYTLKVERMCLHRDVAICSIITKDTVLLEFYVEKSLKPIKVQDNVKLLGFPAHKAGRTYSIIDSTVSQIYPESGVKKFEISSQIRNGNSGGPIINVENKVVGIALEGATKDLGYNGCLEISEIDEVLNNDEYRVSE